jgi:hypothetical protein
MTAVIIRGGKINGRPILKAWESYSGWYWFATEKAGEQLSDFGDGKGIPDTIWFGFVVGTCPEWGYFSQREIESLSPFTWEIKKQDLPYVSKEVRA